MSEQRQKWARGNKPTIGWSGRRWIVIPLYTRMFWEYGQPPENRNTYKNYKALEIVREMNDRLTREEVDER